MKKASVSAPVFELRTNISSWLLDDPIPAPTWILTAVGVATITVLALKSLESPCAVVTEEHYNRQRLVIETPTTV